MGFLVLSMSYLFSSRLHCDSSIPWNLGFMSLRWLTVSKISVISYYSTLSSEFIFLQQLQDILYLHTIWIPSTVMFYTTVFIVRDNFEICLTFYFWLLCLCLDEEMNCCISRTSLTLGSCSNPLIHSLCVIMAQATPRHVNLTVIASKMWHGTFSIGPYCNFF